MNEISNLARLQQLLESMEDELNSAKDILKQLVSGVPEAGSANEREIITSKAKSLSVSEGGKVIEGVFDGQNMVGPDGRIYPVPANYASKSKLVEGDVLKLTISPDGSFIYKQIAPTDRKRILGTLVQDEKGDYRVVAEGRSYKVLLASLTYYKSEPGDQVTLIVPTEHESSWAAVENVIKAGGKESHTGPSYMFPSESPAEINVPEEGEEETSKEPGDRQVRIVTGDDEDFRF